MTTIRTSFFAALGLLVAGSVAPASAGTLDSANSTVAAGDTANLHLITDRGSWVEPRTRWKHDRHYGHDRRYDRYGDHYYRKKHFKKKKKRKYFKRGYRRGYDEGYYNGRRHSYFKHRRHRHHHHYYPHFKFGGGGYFGNGYFNGGSFRFRY